MSAYSESIISSGALYQKNAWMRRIKIVFTSKEKVDINNGRYSGAQVSIGDDDKTRNFSIRVYGNKNIALTKDNGTIEIANVDYDTIAKIMAWKLFRVEIWVGYENNDSLMRMIKGEVSYIAQKIHSRHDNVLYITYASELVAAWSQSRINFSVRSGVNIYSMITNLFMQQGTERVNVTPALKELIAKETFAARDTSPSIIENALSNSSMGLYIDADSSLTDKVVNVTTLGEKRVIPISPNMINIGHGNPTVTSQGLDITLFPVINLVPGDIIKIDNSIVDLSTGMTTTQGAQQTFNSNFMDANGCYMIRQIDYMFENRGNNFYFKCRAISPSVYQGITGVMQ